MRARANRRPQNRNFAFDVTPYPKLVGGEVVPGTLWHRDICSTWEVIGYTDNGDGVVSVCDCVNLEQRTYCTGEPAYCRNRVCGHIANMTGGQAKIKGWYWNGNTREWSPIGVSFQKVTKAAVGINIFNPDTKQTCDLIWTLYLQYENGTPTTGQWI
jgi:hypothetical protein